MKVKDLDKENFSFIYFFNLISVTESIRNRYIIILVYPYSDPKYNVHNIVIN